MYKIYKIFGQTGVIKIELKKYSKKQQDFIEALLSGASIAEAARKAEISVVTSYKWLNMGIREDVDAYRHTLSEHSLQKLKQGMELAVDTLFETLQDPGCPRSIKVNACRVIIENNFRLREQDSIISRLAELEQKYNDLEKE